MPTPMAKTIQQLSRRHGTYNVFADFVGMSAAAFSNAVDRHHYDEREASYMRTVKKYDQPGEANEIASLLGMLTNELEYGPRDVLGELFHELEIHNEHAGQFFTPWNMCQMMAKMNTVGSNVQEIIDRKGYVSVHEPACGSGAMVIAMADALTDEKINYQQAMHVHAIDIDIRCVHMAYTQFSLLGIPAIVTHGNALTRETWSNWYTPQHIMGGWDWRLKMRDMLRSVAEMATAVVDEAAPVADLFADAKPEITPVKAAPEKTPKQGVKKGAKPGPSGTQLTLF